MKIGDEYRYIGETKNPLYTNGAIYKFSGESFGGGILIHNNLMDDHYWDETSLLENFIKVTSPIRTVMRKEIVQGNYGIVAITKRNKVMIAAGKYDAEQLREAAHTLNQIAEALKDV